MEKGATLLKKKILRTSVNLKGRRDILKYIIKNLRFYRVEHGVTL